MLNLQLFRGLSHPLFARLYLAQTINLLGDALTWVGLALLTFELSGQQAGASLAGVLTLRVTTFVLVSPFAGAIADRVNRKLILTVSHLARMLIVALLPWVTQIWHIYLLIVALNFCTALFTPTYKATIPLVVGKTDYPAAIALSSATGQLLSIVGPGLAGTMAALLGTRLLFGLDALSFLIAALLIVTLNWSQTQAQLKPSQPQTLWQDLQLGTVQLWQNRSLRYALGMQLVAAIAGAQILVNTVAYVEGVLQQNSVQYGWVMAAFGLGATIAAVSLGLLQRPFNSLICIGVGAVLMTVMLLPADRASLFLLMVLWLLAGLGESWINVPTQTLIADKVPIEWQGRVYGAHFAWSHLWWVLAYPLAGWLDYQSHQPGWFYQHSFLAGGLIGTVCLIVIQLFWFPHLPPPQTQMESAGELQPSGQHQDI